MEFGLEVLSGDRQLQSFLGQVRDSESFGELEGKEVKTLTLQEEPPHDTPPSQTKSVLPAFDGDALERLFQDVKELLRPTMSGASSSGIGSPASSTLSPKEII